MHHRGTEEDEGAQREEVSFFAPAKNKKNPPSVPPHPPLCLCGASLFSLFLLFLFSCQTKSAWHVTHLSDTDSTRLSYAVQDIVNEVGVQICLIEGQMTTHLEVHSQMIPPYLGNPEEALVKMHIEGKQVSGVARRHDGGQRLTLPLHLQESLVESLKAGKNVILHLEGFSTKLDARQFPQNYTTPWKPWINLLS
jgi:hypothetical protein